MGKTMIRILAALVMLFLLTMLVPSATPLAIGEEAYPAYVPVTLSAEITEAIPFDKDAPYAPHDDAFIPYDPDTPNGPAKAKHQPKYSGYLDDSISVRMEYVYAYDTTIQLTWVQIAHPSQLRAATYRPYPSKSLAYASAIAKREKAVLAINGDWFMNRKEGFIVRNGEEPYRAYYGKNCELFDVLIIDENADMHIIQSYNEEKMNDFIANSGHEIVHAYTFGPALVVNGERNTTYLMDECAPERNTQRIALCQIDSLSYLIVATEGPENAGSKGLTLEQFSQFCLDMGARQAYNFDGGSSSSVILDYKKVNSLSTGKTRTVNDILYFITAVPED